MKEINEIYSTIKSEIESRLTEFKRIGSDGSDRELFIELVFCLLTPQSGARKCWEAVNILLQKDLLLNGYYDDIREILKIVRFRNNKARYLVEARDKFIGKEKSLRSHLNEIGSTLKRRDWLVKNVKGIGYKEASHFLRNIGSGENIAILDRHILKNMNHLGIINGIPGSISPRIYREFETRLQKFSEKIKIPLSHLDFVLWYKETGDIFK